MHDRISIDSLCFPTADFAELGKNWKELGTRRVSIVSMTLEKEGVAAAKAALAPGYVIETIPHPFMGYATSLDPRPETWEKPRAQLSKVIADAKAIGAKSVYLLTGGHGDMVWEDAAEVFAKAIAPCVAQAKAAGIQVAVENSSSNFSDTHLAHTLRDALTLSEIAGIGLCIDFFGCWWEGGLRETIKRAIPRTVVVQASDYVYGDRSSPCRAVLGDGNIPAKRIIDWMLDAGYKGAFDLELIGPRIDKEGHLAATRRCADNLGEILVSLGA